MPGPATARSRTTAHDSDPIELIAVERTFVHADHHGVERAVLGLEPLQRRSSL
jgi:hypothetical protein